ncbi:MAG TPA: ParB/RepB/Spo0J family partition protein [Hanamia sp.]|nr:ParB/RepB/Spo0J family partition protein [Hanamia sp.]
MVNPVGADDRLRSGMNTFQLAMAPTGFVNAGGIAIGENITQIETKELSELNPTHYLTRSRSQMQNLVDDIRVNGIKDPLEYVEFNGKNFVVGGNHRYFAAQRLGIGNVPVKQVDLPFAGYNSTQDLMLEGRMPGYWKFIK